MRRDPQGVAIVRNRWKPGPAAWAEGPFTLSATKFVYRSRLRFLLVAYHGWRLRRGWGDREGAVGLFVGGSSLRAFSYTLSVWTGEQDLRRFLRSPEHVALVRAFKRHQVESASVVWEAEALDREAAWRHGLEKLAARATPRRERRAEP